MAYGDPDEQTPPTPEPVPPSAPPGYAPPGYGAPGYGPPGYGAPGYGPPAPGYGAPPVGYGYGALQEDHPQGVAILILGILGLVTCQILGIVAWVMGNKALAEIDADPARYKNRGMVQAGRICGIVAVCILGAVIAIYALIFAVFGLTSLSA